METATVPSNAYDTYRTVRNQAFTHHPRPKFDQAAALNAIQDMNPRTRRYVLTMLRAQRRDEPDLLDDSAPLIALIDQLWRANGFEIDGLISMAS